MVAKMAASCSSSSLTTSSSSGSYSASAVPEYDSDDETDNDTNNAEQGHGVVSLLDRLKRATPADIARPRLVRKNNPPKGKRLCRGALQSDPKRVTPRQRVKEFATECFVVSRGNLFCSACREELSLKRSVLKNHVSSRKHQNCKERLSRKEARERDIAASLRQYNEQVHQRGETLPEQQQVYRVRIVSTFLKAGVPLNKISKFRDLFEENGARLTDNRGMLDYIPFILKEEESRIRAEIEGQSVAVIFDGTSRVGEALAILLRYIDAEWCVRQRLVRVQMLAKSVTGEELARELISVLSVTYGIKSNMLLAAMRDGASVNGVAIRTVKVVYPLIIDIRCFSHTIDRVGDKFETPTLSDFMTLWICLFSHSPKTRLLWRSRTNKSMPSYSTTRWWSKWEVIKDVLLSFADIEPFLRENEDLGPNLRSKLLAFFNNPQITSKLQIEIAATVDWGEPFVKACYHLEGDGPLSIECYEIIDKVRACIAVENIPNVRGVSSKLTRQPPQHPHHEQWVKYARDCVKNGLEYFENQFMTNLKPALEVFSCCRLFSPQKIREINPTALSLDQHLASIPFIDENELAGLKDELPAYLSKTADLDEAYDPLEWWKTNEATLPRWSRAAKRILLVQPSSAAAERVFSILNSTFGDRQDHSLMDYVESSLMLQYNER